MWLQYLHEYQASTTVLNIIAPVLLALWAASEVLIRAVSIANRPQGEASPADRFSTIVVWLTTGPPLGVALLIYEHVLLPDGPGSFGGLAPLLGYLGAALVLSGLAVRLLAVATLKRQFAVTVSFIDNHQLIQAGLYRYIRHPAYLGLLATELGFGLLSGNWFGLAVLAIAPLAGILYRIRVEEQALQQRFGAAYTNYARRTSRLLPGIY